MSESATAPEDVIVEKGATLTIPNGVSLDINFANYALVVTDGSGVLIRSGGKIY